MTSIALLTFCPTFFVPVALLMSGIIRHRPINDRRLRPNNPADADADADKSWSGQIGAIEKSRDVISDNFFSVFDPTFLTSALIFLTRWPLFCVSTLSLEICECGLHLFCTFHLYWSCPSGFLQCKLKCLTVKRARPECQLVLKIIGRVLKRQNTITLNPIPTVNECPKDPILTSWKLSFSLPSSRFDTFGNGHFGTPPNSNTQLFRNTT